jgi:hypothetical protein
MPIDAEESIVIARRAAKLVDHIRQSAEDGKLTVPELVQAIAMLARLANYAVKAAKD